MIRPVGFHFGAPLLFSVFSQPRIRRDDLFKISAAANVSHYWTIYQTTSKLTFKKIKEIDQLKAIIE